MLRSMTGFARQTQITNWGQLVIEIRSINHRYLDSSFHLPVMLKSLEPDLKEKLGDYVSRGKLDIQIRLNDQQTHKLMLNEGLAHEYISIHQQITDLLNNHTKLSASEIMRLPNIFIPQEIELETIKPYIITLLEQALKDLALNRAREGEKIEQMIQSRIQTMHQLIEQAQVIRPEAIKKLKEKILNKLKEIDIEAAEQRLEQEIVIHTQRLDIDEEIDRFNAHLKEMRAALQREDPIGRRLDFITQELNREANTLSSKSQDINLTKIGIELKVLIEQIREQIQNVE